VSIRKCASDDGVYRRRRQVVRSEAFRVVNSARRRGALRSGCAAFLTPACPRRVSGPGHGCTVRCSACIGVSRRGAASPHRERRQSGAEMRDAGPADGFLAARQVDLHRSQPRSCRVLIASPRCTSAWASACRGRPTAVFPCDGTLPLTRGNPPARLSAVRTTALSERGRFHARSRKPCF
jgi:hypothetical protein